MMLAIDYDAPTSDVVILVRSEAFGIEFRVEIVCQRQARCVHSGEGDSLDEALRDLRSHYKRVHP